MNLIKKSVLNVALIGAGRFGKNYFRLLQEMEGVSLKAVVTRLPRIYEETLPSIFYTTDLKSIMNDSSIQAVIIVTPSNTHFEITQTALRHKKHIFLEKPMVLNLADALLLKRQVEDSDKIFMVGFQYLFNDYISYLKNEIEKGLLGPLNEIQFEHRISTPREDVNCFWDVAPHPLSIFQFLFNPTKLIEVKGKYGRTAGSVQEDFVSVSVRFDQGPLLSIAASYFGEEKIRKITFLGSDSKALLDEVKIDNKLTITNTQTKVVSIPEISPVEPLKNELKHFFYSIHTKQRPITDISFGFTNTQWLEEISDKIQKA